MFDPWSLVDHRRGDSTPHSSRQRKRSRNHRLFFNNARTPNSFFIDCFSFETHSLWKRHHVFKFKIVLVKKLEGKFSGSLLPWTKLKLYKCWNKKKLAFQPLFVWVIFVLSNFLSQWYRAIGWSTLGHPGGVQWLQEVSTNVLTPHFVSFQLHSLCEPCESRVEFDSHWMHPINNVRR